MQGCAVWNGWCNLYNAMLCGTVGAIGECSDPLCLKVGAMKRIFIVHCFTLIQVVYLCGCKMLPNHCVNGSKYYLSLYGL